MPRVGEAATAASKYTLEKGGNDSPPSYQEASGAPVESQSPLGYNVGAVTIIFLNVSKMTGTGVYSTPSAILKGTGSVGLAMIYWALGFLTSIASLSVYLEYAAYSPNRSGSEVWLVPTTFALQSVLLSFSSSNAIGLKGVAIAGFTVVFLVIVFHTRFSYAVSNGIGIIKVLTLVFISVTGLIANFIDSFSGHAMPYGVTNALYCIIFFSYASYKIAFNVINEVKNPMKTIRRDGFIALAIVALLHIFANIAYFAAIPKADLAAAQQIAASLFITRVFGPGNTVNGLNFPIVLSSFNNILAVALGSSRMIRQCGQQGVLSFPRFWASTKPFGAPLGLYPLSVLNVLLAVGLYIMRYRRARLSLPRPEFRAWDPIVIFNVLVNLYLIVMPWYPPDGGPFAGDVHFWYATYVATRLCNRITFCALYYYLWVSVVPKLRGYRLRQETIILGDGAPSHRLIKMPATEVVQWDATHDTVGRPLLWANAPSLGL
ncbi:amino acid permease-domain-containing protein [Chaetomium strumarium]|uniref:Amino acid permease-domain-containing protein n=1 Tax=Chaetomium strumarium TaxID=1170767 RepID=A0AAJ0GYA0_9PEZI|nr:amino acid permease-domain-containing protein [Chaetomium strumarium]